MGADSATDLMNELSFHMETLSVINTVISNIFDTNLETFNA